MTDLLPPRELPHPKVTKAYAKSLICTQRIISDPDLLVTIGITKLKCGHRIVTDAIVANRTLFDTDRGVTIVQRKALEEIIKLELYRLRATTYDNSLENLKNE